MRSDPKLSPRGVNLRRLLRDDNPPVTSQIADFFDGRTNGEDLLHALYDYVLDEPVPENMRALLRKS